MLIHMTSDFATPQIRASKLRGAAWVRPPATRLRVVSDADIQAAEPCSKAHALLSTSEVLTDAVTRGVVHGWLEDLQFASGSVEHLVLTCDGTFAVTSVGRWVGLDHHTVERIAADLTLATQGSRMPAGVRAVNNAVRPIVAVWGPASTDVPAGGLDHDGVLFVRGCDLGAFFTRVYADGGDWTMEAAAQATRHLSDLATGPMSISAGSSSTSATGVERLV